MNGDERFGRDRETGTGRPRSFEPLLHEIRRSGARLSVQGLAGDLLAVRGALAPGLARRLVATVLECSEQELSGAVEADLLRAPEERAVASIPLREAVFAVVDLETTGLSSEESEILEIGAVRVGHGRIEDPFEVLVRPVGAIPARIRELTGIDEWTADSGRPLIDAMRAWCDWLHSAAPAPFVAHNATFDERFIRAALARCRLGPLRVPVLCTRRLARRLAPELGRYGLDHLCAHFGISNGARHRALGDARAAARVLTKLLERAHSRGLKTVGDLIDLQQGPASAGAGGSVGGRVRGPAVRW